MTLVDQCVMRGLLFCSNRKTKSDLTTATVPAGTSFPAGKRGTL